MSYLHTLESALARLPDDLRPAPAKALADFNAQLPDFNPDPAIAASMVPVWCASEFIAESCVRQPSLLVDLADSGDLRVAYPAARYGQRLSGLAITDQASLMRALRVFRRREMIRIAWRDLAGWAELSETLLELSWLAEACIQYALAWLYQQACAKYGTPLLANGAPQQLVVLGMGKLGAFELNYSSDIDLIFAYPENGELPDRKATSYGEFFTRVCQNLVKVLDETTADGFVFRTDIRLRPFGDSGPIIMTFDGMEHYYQTQAREWERYAMIKARQVAGDVGKGAELMAMLRAFVYRRYLDYGAFEELRGLKAQISQELRRKDRLDNIKLGAGGIREIEFIGQAFQLIRGGNEKALQTRGIMDVLRLLGELGLMAAHDSAQLQQSYCFLRRTENHIQQYQDRQTHDVPTADLVQKILAHSLGYTDVGSFKRQLDAVRAQVHNVFDQVFSVSRQAGQDQRSQQLWAAVADDAELWAHLRAYGFADPEASLNNLKHFKNAPSIRRLTSKGAKVLDQLLPQLIVALAQTSSPDVTLQRLLALFEAVAGRNVYLALLAENPDALAQLIRLAAASPWLCDYLARYPVLFDELLDTRSLYEPLQKTYLEQRLGQLLAAVEGQDLEQLMIVLRQFKQLNVLRVAAADIMGQIPVMVVSDYLTYIAEVVVAEVVERAWLMLVEKHGCPPNASAAAKGFAVIGMGKLGGIELGYGSDLDLLFLYDDNDGNALTDGGKPISSAQFYGRLGLKVRHILDTPMLSGILYEVDMRLRPSGNAGLLVTHVSMYEDYLNNQAWTWEHQALVRGRFIAGDRRLKTEYEAIRQRILSLPRDTAVLKTDVREMREKMRASLDTKVAGQFDLKQSPGGIADIEFIVQFGVLANAHQYPSLTTYTDNVRLLEGLATQGFISDSTAATLTAAYCHYRDTGHKLVLQGGQAQVTASLVQDDSQAVCAIWQTLMA